jgi:hypothetical protein
MGSALIVSLKSNFIAVITTKWQVKQMNQNEDKVSIYVFFVFGFAVFFILDLVLIKLSQGR